MEHKHLCQFGAAHDETFGCECACGAIFYGSEWQTPREWMDRVFSGSDRDPCAAKTYEYRVLVPGGRGGRDNGYHYQGTDRKTAEWWVEQSANAWMERREIGAWERVEA